MRARENKAVAPGEEERSSLAGELSGGSLMSGAKNPDRGQDYLRTASIRKLNH
jgi:hypothetical protein